MSDKREEYLIELPSNMKAVTGIKSGQHRGDSSLGIARKLYLSYPTEVFKDREDDEFAIRDSIAKEFDIPFVSIQIVGSCKTGISFFKDRLFATKESDLDVAIISNSLYTLFAEKACAQSESYSDLSVFPTYRGQRTDRAFIDGMVRGFINPFYMPTCELRTRWLNYFNKLSNSYYELFKNINAGLYASEYFFEAKQRECVERYLDNPKKYDQISGAV